MEKINIRKILIQSVIFLLFVIGVISMLIKGQSIKQILGVVRLATPKYLIAGMIMSIIFVALDALNIKTLLKALSYKITFIRAVKYSCNGLFFSAITPGSTGGQPMQLYAMKKDNIEIAKGSIILLIQFACYQFIVVTLGIIAILSVWKSLNLNLIKTLVIMGFCINSAMCIFVSFSIVSKRFINKIHQIGHWIIDKIPFEERKKENLQYKLEMQIKEYGQCSVIIKESRIEILKVLLITLLQVGCLFSIPCFVYKALGGTAACVTKIFLLQGVIQITASFMPVPGGVGVSEGLFLNLFKKIYSIGQIKSAMLLSRGISFYLVLVMTGIVLGCNQAKYIIDSTKTDKV